MNDIFYEIIMKSAVLITGSTTDKQNLLLNLFLSIANIFPGSLCAIDMAGSSSTAAGFANVQYIQADILDTLRQLRSRLDAPDGHDKTKPIYLYISNIDLIISLFYGREKREAADILCSLINRGQAAHIHIIATCTQTPRPSDNVLSCFTCRAYAGRCDKKTAAKFFPADGQYIRRGMFPGDGQAIIQIDGTIYFANIPSVSVADFMLICSADSVPTAPEKANTQRTETALQPDIQQYAQQPYAISADTDKNIFALILFAIITLFSGVLDDIHGIITDNAIIKFAVFLVSAVLYIILLPIKFLYAVASSSGYTGFSGGFTVLCMLYMIICAATGLIV